MPIIIAAHRLESDIIRYERDFGPPRLHFWKRDAHYHGIVDMNEHRLEALVKMYEVRALTIFCFT